MAGVGYDLHGGFNREGREIDPGEFPLLTELLRTAASCNDAVWKRCKDAWIGEGDPMKGLCWRRLSRQVSMIGSRPGICRVPTPFFDAEPRFMARLHHDHEGRGFLFVKGVPERILEMREQP